MFEAGNLETCWLLVTLRRDKSTEIIDIVPFKAIVPLAVYTIPRMVPNRDLNAVGSSVHWIVLFVNGIGHGCSEPLDGITKEGIFMSETWLNTTACCLQATPNPESDLLHTA